MLKVNRRLSAAFASAVIAACLAQPSARAELVGYWKMEEASGQPRLDSSGRGNTLTSVGDVRVHADGAVRRAAEYFATSRYLTIADADQSGLAITGSVTIAAWVYRTGTSSPIYTVASRWGTDNRMSFRLVVTGGTDGVVRASVSPQGTDVYDLSGTTPITTNTWHHIAMVYNSGGKRVSVYVNGVLDNTVSTAFSQLYTTTAPFTVGASYDATTRIDAWSGRIDELRVYNSALSQSDIAKLCASPGAFSLSSPAHESTDQTLRPTVSWEASTGALEYDVVIATSSTLTSGIVASATGLTTRSFKPASNLNPTTDYYWGVTAIGTGAARTHNPSSGTNGSFKFRTGALPGTFSQSAPSAGATNQSLTVAFTWTASSGAADYLLEYADNDQFISPRAIVFPADEPRSYTPVPQLAYSTTYWWRVTARNHVGERLVGPRTFTTKADNDPPVIVKSTPAHGASNASVSKPLTVLFDEELLETSVIADGAVVLRDSESEAVPATVSLTASGWAIRVDPVHELLYDSTYTLSIAGSIKDLLNNSKGTAYDPIEFTTLPPIAGIGAGEGCGASGAPFATALLLIASCLVRRR